jgi:hypothetical protein
MIAALIMRATGGEGDEGKELTPTSPESHPNGIYEPSEKHRAAQRGRIGARPTDGQKVLDNSVPIKPETTTRRVGVDEDAGEIVVLDETEPGVYHGHVRTWGQLTDDMRKALVRAGLTNRRGKVISK